MLSIDKLRSVVEPYFENEKLKLCELKIAGGPGRPQIIIKADLEVQNITIDQCVSVNRDLQDLIDMQSWSPKDYQLQVSSPGLDFPLSEVWQFRKNLGRKIRWRTEEVQHEGRIESIDSDNRVSISDSEEVTAYAVNELVDAKVILEMPSGKSRKSGSTRRKKR